MADVIVCKIKIAIVLTLVFAGVLTSCSSQTKNVLIPSDLSWMNGEWYGIQTNNAGIQTYEYLLINHEFAKFFDLNYADSYEYCLATSPTRRFLIKNDTLSVRWKYEFDPKEKDAVTENRLFKIDKENKQIIGELLGEKIIYKKVSLNSAGFPVELPPYIVSQSNYNNVEDDHIEEKDDGNSDNVEFNNDVESNGKEDVLNSKKDSNSQSTVNESNDNTGNIENESE